jgi:hypothetical protein
LDGITKKFVGDLASILVILLITSAAFWRYPVPGVLLAGGLALTIFVAADVVLFRKG